MNGEMLEVLEAVTQPLGNPLGAVEGGRLKVQGYLCKILKGGKVGQASVYILSQTEELRDVHLYFSFDQMNRYIGAVFFLPIRCLLVYDSASTLNYPLLGDAYGVEGLLLEATGVERGQFRRIERLSVSDESNLQLLWRAFASKDICEENFKDFNGNNLYTIDII